MKIAIKLCILGVVLFAVSSCGSDKKSSNCFPGFTQVGKDTKTAKLYVDLNPVRKEAGIVNFKMIRALENGYVMQDASTDCREIFQSFDGVQYKDDGTSDKKYSGDKSPISFKEFPELNALATMVCNKANENQVIVGSFDDLKALELLYGKYDSNKKAALWKNVRTGNKENPVEGQDAWVSPILSKQHTINGVTKQIFITKAIPKTESYSCHACVPSIGAAIFFQSNGKWSIEEEYPYLGMFGKFGEPDEMEWVKIADNRYALIIKSADMHQGYAQFATRIYKFSKKGMEPIFESGGAIDNNKEEYEEGYEEGEWIENITFEKVNNAEYYDLRCLRKLARHKGQVEQKKKIVTYKFVDGKYIENKK